MQYLQSLGYTEMNMEGIGMIMANAMIEFKSELFYPETIRAYVTTGEITRVSFELYYKLERKTPGKEHPLLIATVKTTMVGYDYTKKKIVAMEDIQEAVAAWFHIKIADLKSRRRSKTLVHPRQIAMYLCRELTDSSFPEIGRLFGGKDHTTIIHACRQITKVKDGDATLNATLESLREEILRG